MQTVYYDYQSVPKGQKRVNPTGVLSDKRAMQALDVLLDELHELPAIANLDRAARMDDDITIPASMLKDMLTLIDWILPGDLESESFKFAAVMKANISGILADHGTDDQQSL